MESTNFTKAYTVDPKQQLYICKLQFPTIYSSKQIIKIRPEDLERLVPTSWRVTGLESKRPAIRGHGGTVRQAQLNRLEELCTMGSAHY